MNTQPQGNTLKEIFRRSPLQWRAEYNASREAEQTLAAGETSVASRTRRMRPTQRRRPTA